MLKLIVNNTECDLGDLGGIELQFNSSMFNFTGFEGSYSIPFNLPVSEINNRILNFPYRIGVADKAVRELPAQLWHSGIKVAEGTLRAEFFEKDTFSCDFFIDNGDLFSKIKDKKINEHYLGEQWKDQYFDLQKIDYDIDSDLFVAFPVYNPQFFANLPGFFLGANYLQNNFLGPSGYDPNSTIITPFPLLHQTLKLLFNTYGYRYVDDFFVTDDLKRVTIFSLRNIMMKTPDGDPYVYPRIPDNFNIAEQLPTITIGDFLIQVQNYFNIFFLIKNKTVTIIDRNIALQSSSYTDCEQKIIGDYTKRIIQKLDGWILKNAEEKINYTLHTSVPDYSDYDDSEIVESAPTGTPEKVGIVNFFNEFIYLSQLKEGEVLEIEWRKEQTHLKDGVTSYDNSKSVAQMSSYFDGKRELEIKFPAAPVPNWVIIGADTAVNCMPWYEAAGNTLFSKVKVDIPLKFLLYKGIVSRVYSWDANYKDNCPYGAAGNPNDTYYLGARGAYNFHWKDFIPWYIDTACEEYEQYLDLKVSEIKNFDFTKKIKMHNELWFVKALSVQLTKTSIMPSKAIIIKANF